MSRKRAFRQCTLRIATKPIPGTLEQGGAPFQTTHWTVVLEAGQADSDETARKALSTFTEARGFDGGDLQRAAQLVHAARLKAAKTKWECCVHAGCAKREQASRVTLSHTRAASNFYKLPAYGCSTDRDAV